MAESPPRRGFELPEGVRTDEFVTKARLQRVLELIDQILEAPERKARFNKAQLEELRAIGAAEHLGIVRVIDEEATFTGGILDRVAESLAHHKGSLSVGVVRAALDPDGLLELSPEVQDFLVLAYAKAAPRPLHLLAQGLAGQALIGKLSDSIGLAPIDLPGEETWQAAQKTASIFKIPAGRALAPGRVDELAKAAKKAASELGLGRVGEAIRLLGELQREAGITDLFETTPRGSVLVTLLDLAFTVSAAAGSMGVVKALARYAWDPGRASALAHMAAPKAIDELIATLRMDSLRAPIMSLRSLEEDPAQRAEAAPVMDRVRAALVLDDNVEPLRAALEREAARITQILAAQREITPAPEPGHAGVKEKPASGYIEDTTQPSPLNMNLAPTRPVIVMESETHTLASPADVVQLADSLRARVEAGTRLRVTIQTMNADEE